MKTTPILACALAIGLSSLLCSAGQLDLLVSGYWTHNVVRFDAVSGAYIDDFIPSGTGGLDLAEGLALGPDGFLYVSSVGYTSPHVIKRYNARTGEYLGDFATGGGLDSPRGITFGPDGNLYVCSDYSHEILRYDGETGTFIDAFVPPGRAGMQNPEDLIFRDGYLYVSNHGTDTVLRFAADTGTFVDVFAADPSLNNPHGMEFGPDGNLYVVSSATDSVLRFDGQTGDLIDVFVPSGSGGLLEPDNLLFALQGDVYVSSYGGNSILRYDGTTGDFQGLFAAMTSPTYMLIIPEPATLALLALGGAVLAARRRQRSD